MKDNTTTHQESSTSKYTLVSQHKRDPITWTCLLTFVAQIEIAARPTIGVHKRQPTLADSNVHLVLGLLFIPYYGGDLRVLRSSVLHLKSHDTN
jgi:hypothetical protein